MRLQTRSWFQSFLVLALLMSNGLFVHQSLAQAGSSTNTGSMSYARMQHTAMLLPNGKVMVFGGTYVDSYGNETDPTDPELYNPATGTWKTTSMGIPLTPRGTLDSSPITLLADGRILHAGGIDTHVALIPIVQLFDPVSETWTNTGSLVSITRVNHTATLLPNGKVLVAGGFSTGINPTTSVEIYDPATGMWTTNGNLLTARGAHTATLLPNGKVLIVGGQGFVPIGGTANTLASAELYDPGSGTATPIVLNNAAKLPSGAFQIGFSNAPGASFTALATTNVSLPTSNWTTLGSVPEILSGQYQFTDPQATNNPTRFYRVKSP